MSVSGRDAELAVTAAALMNPKVLPRLMVEEGIGTDHFADPFAARVFAAMCALHDEDRAIDPVTVAERAGLPAGEVDALAAHLPAVGAIREHARIVARHRLRRTWRHAGQLLQQAAVEDDEQLVAQAEQALASPTVSDDTYSTQRLGDEVFEYLNGQGAPGISTGMLDLDDIIGGGLRPGDTTVIAAWESMGKSCLVDDILEHAAGQGRRVHAYINEMSPTDRALRMVARQGAVSWGKIARRNLTDQERSRIVAAMGRLPFGLTEASQWSAEQIARHARANRWDIWALDVLHNMPYQYESELAAIVATLAAAARSSNGHLILVCHLNQERAKDDLLPRPVIRDLRGSGMIAKLAANVLMLHRKQQRTPDGLVDTSLIASLIADKARHGRRGDGIDLAFEPKRMSFRLANHSDRNLEAAA